MSVTPKFTFEIDPNTPYGSRVWVAMSVPADPDIAAWWEKEQRGADADKKKPPRHLDAVNTVGCYLQQDDVKELARQALATLDTKAVNELCEDWLMNRLLGEGFNIPYQHSAVIGPRERLRLVKEDT